MFANRQPTRKATTTTRPSALSRFGSGSAKATPSEASSSAASSTVVSRSPASSVASLTLSDEPAPTNGRASPSKASTMPAKRQLTRQDSLRPSALKRFSTSAVSLVKGQGLTNGAETPVPVAPVSGSPTSSVSSLPIGPDPGEGATRTIEELRTKLDAAEEALTTEQSRLTTLEERIRILEVAKEEHVQEEATQRERQLALNAQLDELRAQLARSEDEVHNRDRELEAARAEAAQGREAQEGIRRGLERELADVRSQLLDAQEVSRRRADELEAASREAGEAVNERSALQQKVGDLEVSLKTALDNGEQERRRLNEEIAKLKEDLKKAPSAGCTIQ
ncbi:uncharacterized protein B0H18DRAFT_974670 [Fomitopsis serialis]|uniref:uncharacterized protein n=1 Tax=Fomitopsis serialis TaxID=139415 RepID=UPI002007F939|nr:uncharacterized protein B0H18DRAFT_974670 [Neoantrodia serialis]KAH9936614.1 hypothetical protein B0H18DRAFT_974670 [Neoantrodia serialis]